MRKLILAAIVILSFTSCKIVFTEQVRKKVEMNGIELNKIQFYNSEEIMLKRVLTSSEASLASGKVKFQNGEYIEIIEIKRNTPGKCDLSSSGRLLISFEYGDNRNLRFINENISDTLSTYNFKADNCKLIKVEKPIFIGSNETETKTSNECSVKYDDKIYKVEYSTIPKLLIRKKQINKSEINRRTAKGIKVN